MNKTPEQIAAIETQSKYLCVDAGAGSGKTLALVDRVVHLLENRLAKLDEIVAITFTEKAAAEMKARLRDAFHKKAPPDDPEAMSFWRDLERRAETARISTIHSFCAVLLRENALHIGLDPDFTVLADAEATLLRMEVVADTLHHLLEDRNEAALRVAAEFGMGKLSRVLDSILSTRALIERIRSEHPLDDPDALKRHWAGLVEAERRRRIEALKGSRVLRRLRDQLKALDGTCKDPSEPREILRLEMLGVMDELLSGVNLGKAENLLRGLAGGKARTKKTSHWVSIEAHEQLRELQGRVAKFANAHLPQELDETVEQDAARLTCDFYTTYEVVVKAFQEAKAVRTGLDFDNLIADALAMLRQNREVRTRVARGIKHLLIDEFQDTDSGQLEIAQLLANEAQGPDLFIVGDAKQSIYDFRGAEVEVFQREREAAEKVIPLDRNFRSLPDILAIVNDFFTASGLLEAVEPQYHLLAAHREPVRECRVEFLVPEVDEDANADDYRRKEAELIAWRIAALCRGPQRVQVYDKARDIGRPADLGDIALLFRSMSSVYFYEEALQKCGIPYQVVAGAGFYERQEVLDVRNLLTVLVDPGDEVAWLGFLRSPIAGLSDESLTSSLEKEEVSKKKPEGLRGEQADRLAAACQLVADLRARTEMPLPAFLRYVLNRTGYEAILLSQFLGVQKASNVRKVIDLADDFARTRSPNLSAFVRYLEEVARAPEVREGEAAMQPEGSGAATLMTIHKSKGLEFPIVVIPDISRQARSMERMPIAMHRRLGLAAKVTDIRGEPASPSIFEAITQERKALDQAEHARVLYVAMTRARDWLILGGAPKQWKNSWLDEFDRQYGLLRKPDGAAFGGDGWRARMRRVPGDAATNSARCTVHGALLPSREALEARVGPVDAKPARRNTFAVTSLLDAMGLGAEDKVDATPSHLPATIDPLLRGTLVHQMLERWDVVADVRPTVESICRRNCPALRVREALTSDLMAVAERIAQSPLGQRMAREQAVVRERSFLLRVGGALVSGAIDAVLPDGTIVDYKTGRYTPSMHARYEAQLCLYAAAVRTLLCKEPPQACLYYVDTGKDYDVDVSPGRVEAVLRQAKEAIEGTYAGPGS